MASPLLVEGEEPITFAEIEPKHRDKLVEMHEELFPVSYSKQFYNKAIKKEGLRGGPLFTSIAFQKRNGVDEMVGFVMAQFLPILKCDERCELFDGMSEPPLVYYILTLGIDKQMRRTGLGTELLRQCIRNASSDPNCGALYLHVISYNIPALCFYKKNGFISITEFPGFYKIHDRSYTSELCSLYINGFKPPLMTRLNGFFSAQGNSVFKWIKYVLHIDTPTAPLVQNDALYMDDIILPSKENNLTRLTKKTDLIHVSPPPSSSPHTVEEITDEVPPGFLSLDNNNNHQGNENDNGNDYYNNNSNHVINSNSDHSNSKRSYDERSDHFNGDDVDHSQFFNCDNTTHDNDNNNNDSMAYVV